MTGKIEQPAEIPATGKNIVKRVPQRTCVVCRSVKNKKDLVRLVKKDGTLVVDPKGKLEGRGIYLCSRRECWEQALENKSLERFLQAKISSENRTALVEYSKNFISCP